MNSHTILSDSFKGSELKEISLKITKLRDLIGGHIISIDSNYENIIDDIIDNDLDETTADNIIDNVIYSISENDDTITDQVTETNEKNSFSVSTADMEITNNVSQFLNTETESNMNQTESYNGNNKIKKYKISK